MRSLLSLHCNRYFEYVLTLNGFSIIIYINNVFFSQVLKTKSYLRTELI